MRRSDRCGGDARMNQPVDRELEELLNRLVDGEFSAEDECLLQAKLDSDAASRRHYRHFMQLHGALHWDYVIAAAQSTSPRLIGKQPVPRNERPRMLAWWGSLAAMLILAVGWAWLSSGGRTPDRPTIVWVETVDGAVVWSGDVDRRSNLTSGEQLLGGTLTLEGDAASIQLRFRDGTLLTLYGDAELDFEDEGQKRLDLKRGQLSVDARPQPKNKPMLVRTPTAEMEVVGTVFTLSAEPQSTQLNVESGKVRMRRLVDGRTVDVDQERTAVATFDSVDVISPAAPAAPPLSFRRTFSQAIPVHWRGEWMPPEEHAPGRVRFGPLVAHRLQDGTPVVQAGMTIRDPVAYMQPIVQLTSKSIVTVRYRCEKPTRFRIMLGTNYPGGRFGGNFQTWVSTEDGRPTADGWREVSLKCGDFPPMIERFSKLPEPGNVSLILLSTKEPTSDLEVSEIAIGAER
ncbi:MAG: hypothetical protein C0483_21055 [Pirellula sp.]|nr:hypothetical protein [Pirellula sp.]